MTSKRESKDKGVKLEIHVKDREGSGGGAGERGHL